LLDAKSECDRKSTELGLKKRWVFLLSYCLGVLGLSVFSAALQVIP
jgi:hypothetical protein